MICRAIVYSAGWIFSYHNLLVLSLSLFVWQPSLYHSIISVTTSFDYGFILTFLSSPQFFYFKPHLFSSPFLLFFFFFALLYSSPAFNSRWTGGVVVIASHMEIFLSATPCKNMINDFKSLQHMKSQWICNKMKRNKMKWNDSWWVAKIIIYCI